MSQSSSAIRSLIFMSYNFYSFCQRTPLHIAVKEGYEHIVKYLVEKGANVNIQDKKKVSTDILWHQVLLHGM